MSAQVQQNPESADTDPIPQTHPDAIQPDSGHGHHVASAMGCLGLDAARTGG